jgi:hypothetical protein
MLFLRITGRSFSDNSLNLRQNKPASYSPIIALSGSKRGWGGQAILAGFEKAHNLEFIPK